MDETSFLSTGGTSIDRLTTALGMPGSRAVVVGTASHVDDSELPDIPAVTGTVDAVAEALVQRCGLALANARTLTDPADPRAFWRELADTVAEAEDVLLFYYIGHGLVSLGGELYLATRETRDGEIGLDVEALSFAAVRKVLSACRARSVVVVLDCCFSGRAGGSFGTAVADAFELMQVRDSFLLSSASATEQAMAPEGEPYTAFSGALLEFLRNGDRTAPRYLTLEAAYRHLKSTLPARGLPAPHRRAGDLAGELVLAVNEAAPPVIRRRAEQSPGEESPADSGSCPYPGLSSFTVDNARYFFGRDRLADEALKALAGRADTGPVVLVGRSGAGKSSLLQAGLLPEIKKGHPSLPGSRYWPQLIMTPGSSPLHTLATRLAAPAGLTAGEVRTRLAADSGQLAEVAGEGLRRAAGSRPGHDMDQPGDDPHRRGEDQPRGLVLCVDQFEEVFTECRDESERRAFIKALCGAGQAGPGTRVLVILGLRADFYGHCLAYPELEPALRSGQLPVRPMTPDELRAAIEGPADAAGLRIEECLADRLLHDLGDPGDSGAVLPMLSYTLQETWRAGNGRVLTLSDYQATGGIWNAVTQAAERTYSQLRQTARDGAKLLLVSMIRLGDGTDDVRSRIRVPDLLEGRQAAERAAILEARDAFVGARLISVAEDTAEITHEALLRAWPRLRQWISEDRKDLLDRQRLADAARTWDTEGRQRDTLYAGGRLEMARSWLGKDGDRRGPLSPLEREFLETSVRAARRRRGRRWLSGSVAVVAAVALVAALVNARQPQAGNRASQSVESSVQLAQEADDLRAGDPAGALWLSLAAYHSAATPQARSSMYSSLAAPYPVTLPGKGRGAAVSVAYSPDGRTVAAAWHDGTVRLWRVTDPLHPARIAEFRASRHGGAEIAFSPDGRLLATHTAQALKLWNVRDPARPVRVSAFPMGVPAGLHGRLPVAFSPDGRVVATGNPDGRFRLLDVSHPDQPALDAIRAADGNGVNGVAFSPDGKTLATASAIGDATSPDGGRVRLWDVRVPRKPSFLAVRAVTSAIALAFSPVGHLLVSVGALEDAHTWNVTDPGHPRHVKMSSVDESGGAGAAMDSIAFRPDGKVFATADTARRTDIWTVGSDKDVGPHSLLDPAGTYSVAYSPSGRQLITGDLHGSVQLWTALVPSLPGTLSTFDSGARFGHGGKLLVTDGLDINGPASKITGGATLWNVSDPLRPVRAASLPRAWPSAEFLPGGRVLLAWNNNTGRLRLWDTTDPRRPMPGATFPAGGAPPKWDANNRRLLAVLDSESSAVQVWNVRDVRRRVLDATIPAGQSPQGVWLLGDGLLGVVGSRDMRLWDLADPRHPVREGVVPDVGLFDGGRTFVPSTRLLTGEGLSGPTPAPVTTVWSLADPRRPVKLTDIDADPGTIGWVDEHTIAASTADNNAVGLWRVRASGSAAQTDAQPVGPHGPFPLIANGDGGLLAEAIFPPDDVLDGTLEVWRVSGDHRHLSALAQLPGFYSDYEFSPDGGELVTYLNPTASDELQAFPQYDSALVIFPLNADALYRRLCSVAMSAPMNPAWKQYLPTTSYRPACS